MPGPGNVKKKKKQQTGKEKSRTKKTVLKEVEQNVQTANELQCTGKEMRLSAPNAGRTEGRAYSDGNTRPRSRKSPEHDPRSERPPPIIPSVPSLLENPFITDPGNGPRVKNAEAYLSSFFCPPLSLEDESCAAFAREEVLTVLLAVLPREVALIVWYNKTRKYGRICPACQRLYRLGDSLVDPVSGAPIDVNGLQTPPQVLREQQLSGICSTPCFLLASYTSHPYVAEVARGAWGLLSEELDAQTRSLLDATDPETAALVRYGLAACGPSQGSEAENMDDQGLGRVMRMTRRKDLGLGEVLEAVSKAIDA